MLDVVGQVLGNAVGIAISPVPIIAIIVVLFSQRARSNGPAFVVGWVVGTTAVVSLFTLIGPLGDGDDPGTASGIISLVFGALFWFLAWRQWRGRPQPGEEPKTPALLTAIEQYTPVKALGTALLLSVVNPKNLGLGAAAGATIGAAELPTEQTVGVIVIVVAIASCTVAIPVLGYLVAPGRARPVLESAKTWLIHNNATVMLVLFLVLGAKLIGDGLLTLS